MAPAPLHLLRRQQYIFQREKGSILLNHRIACSLLSWLFGFLSLFVLTALYSPHPFRVSTLVMLDGSDDYKVVSVQKSEASCDLNAGRWVLDPTSGLAYTSADCPTMPDSKNCAKYGKDMDYANWRWKPYDCELPVFNPHVFLDRVRGKTMTFIGDSVARNQFDSLICLLSQVESPRNIYKDQDDRFRTWHFGSHSFTLKILWTRFLVSEFEQHKNGSATGVFDLHVDKVDPSWANSLTKETDFLVISSGHWFFRKLYLYENNTLIGCVFCSEPNVPSINIANAIQKVFRTALEFITNCKTCEGVTTFVRTFSPAHFENGSWNNGGVCNRTRPLKEEEIDVNGTYWDISRQQLEAVSQVKIRSTRKKLKFVPLDITRAMLMRADGHPNSHWDNKWNNGFNDCVHWCLPGPIDLWNQLLSAAMDR